MTPDPHSQDLGRLEGIVDMLRDQHMATHAKLDAMSGEITSLKVEAGKQGAVYGGVMAIGVALIIEGAKGWLKQKTGGAGPG
jgi:hypothetical protein